MQAFLTLLFFTEEINRPTYHATPIASKAEPLVEEDSGKKKPRLEYRPIPIFKPTATYTATVIKKKEDSNSYVPLDGETKPSSVTYVPTKIHSTSEPVVKSEKVAEDPATNYTNGNDSHSSHENGLKVNSETKVKEIKIDHSQKVESTEKKDSKSSSKHHRSSSSSKKSSKHHKSSRHDSHKDSSSRSHKHKSSRHKSSSRLGSSRDKSSSSSRKHRESSCEQNQEKNKKSGKDKDEEKKEKVIADSMAPNLEETLLTSDEDDIEEQCRQIFEDYKPDESLETPTPPKRPKTTESEDEPQVADKKRQAHENAANVIRPTSHVKPNHSQSAMLFAQRRQNLALQKAIAERKAHLEEIERIEAEIKEKEQEQLTPLVNPLIQYRPPKRPMISPISHRVAIEAAKRKVVELNKARDAQFQRSTPAQTAAKTTGRVAHAPSTLTPSDVDLSKLAPPIKEPQSTKISSNIRSQYYQIMVKNCLQIYPLPVDGKHQ